MLWLDIQKIARSWFPSEKSWFVFSIMAVIKGCNLSHLLQLSVLDFLLMLQVKLPVIERTDAQSNNFAMGVEKKGYIGDWKPNDSPGNYCQIWLK